MKKLFLISSFFVTSICTSQTDIDYLLVNSALPDIGTAKVSDTIFFYPDILKFENASTFFTRQNFQEYTQPTLTVDTKKVKKLLCKLDFEYLSKQNPQGEKWDTNRLSPKIVVYSDSTKERFKGKRQYQISMPIYSKDQKYAFIQYNSNCGFMDCDSKSIRVYKRTKGKWVFYTQMPISLS